VYGDVPVVGTGTAIVSDCPRSIVFTAAGEEMEVVARAAALTVIVLESELATNGVVVPRSVTTTLKVWLPVAGTFTAKVNVPADWPASVLTTVPLLTRLTVNEEPVPVSIVLYTTACPRSRRTLDGIGAETVGSALTVIVLDALQTEFGEYAESTLL
jgi:hypothetical protein